MITSEKEYNAIVKRMDELLLMSDNIETQMRMAILN